MLYPGSFIHVTPSFYFQHVVYVDRSDFALDFFSRSQAVLDITSARKMYRQRPFIRFLQHDFTHDLPVPQGSFDVLLALFAGGISHSCARYVKPGGWILSNDHHGDARDAAANPELELKVVVLESCGKVHFEEDGLDRFALSVEPNRPGRRNAPTVDYFLFRKLSPARHR